MRDEIIRVVEIYIDAVRRNDAGSLPLHPDAVCEFPTNTYRGVAAFREGLDRFARIVKRIDVIRLVVDGEHCVALLNIETVFGAIPFAEHIHVRHGQIVSIRGYCDPRPMLDPTAAAQDDRSGMRPEWSFTVPGVGVIARPIERADAAEWFAFAALPQVMEHTSSFVSTVSDLESRIVRSDFDKPSSPLWFALRDVLSGAMVGTLCFHTVWSPHRSAEIAYELNPAYWGRGIGTASCKAAVAWGFSTRGFVRIQAAALESNLASRRVLQKCGFEFEGVLRNFRIVRGEPRDYMLFSTVRADD